MVWVSCRGENPADQEYIGPLNYYPWRGFPGYYFPYRNTPGDASVIVTSPTATLQVTLVLLLLPYHNTPGDVSVITFPTAKSRSH